MCASGTVGGGEGVRTRRLRDSPEVGVGESDSEVRLGSRSHSLLSLSVMKGDASKRDFDGIRTDWTVLCASASTDEKESDSGDSLD